MMAEQPPQGAEKYLDREVITSDGKKLGEGSKLLKNRVSEIPEWIVIETGLFGRKRIVVPLAGSDLGEDSVTIPYTSEVVEAQPHTEPDDENDTLPAADDDALNRHFGLGAHPSS